MDLAAADVRVWNRRAGVGGENLKTERRRYSGVFLPRCGRFLPRLNGRLDLVALLCNEYVKILGHATYSTVAVGWATVKVATNTPAGREVGDN